MHFALRFDFTSVEDAIESIEPTVGSPSQTVRQLVSIEATEASGHDFRFVGFVVTVCVLDKKNIRRVSDPDAAITDCNARGNIETFGEDFDAVYFAVSVGVFEDFDAIATWAWFVARVLEAFGDPDATSFVKSHRDGIHDVRFGGDQFDTKSFGHLHFLDRLGRRKRWSWRFRLSARDRDFSFLGC